MKRLEERFRVGSVVYVRAFPNKKLMRRVLEVRRSIVVVTSDEEWRAAKIEGREPKCIGFPASDVTEIQTSR